MRSAIVNQNFYFVAVLAILSASEQPQYGGWWYLQITDLYVDMNLQKSKFMAKDKVSFGFHKANKD